MPIFDMLFEEPSPGPVKYLLTETWEDVGSPLMPITDITPDLANKILDYYKKIKKD
jgi:dihydrodipicolinate synthase/N-acetylneuraminate lyase